MKYSISEQSNDLRKSKYYSDQLKILVRQNIELQHSQEKIIFRLDKVINRLEDLKPRQITDEDISFIKEMTEA